MTDAKWALLSESTANVFYGAVGLLFLLLGIRSWRRNQGWQRYTSFAFWFCLFVAFAFGSYLPPVITGALIVLMGLFSLLKGVVPTRHRECNPADSRREANRIGYWILLPVGILAFSAFFVAQLFPKLGVNNAIGISGVLGAVATLLVTGAHPVELVDDGIRLLDNVGTSGILPQLLAALGSVYKVAGVGTVLAGLVAVLIPTGNHFVACVVYCLSMALFTMIMGSGFGAFAVITVGIGVPFLVQQGANPAIVGALGMTAGYCGTLLTPMAANYNLVPVSLLGMKDDYGVIRAQVPVAFVLLLLHIFLLYFLAF